MNKLSTVVVVITMMSGAMLLASPAQAYLPDGPATSPPPMAPPGLDSAAPPVYTGPVSAGRPDPVPPQPKDPPPPIGPGPTVSLLPPTLSEQCFARCMGSPLDQVDACQALCMLGAD